MSKTIAKQNSTYIGKWLDHLNAPDGCDVDADGCDVCGYGCGEAQHSLHYVHHDGCGRDGCRDRCGHGWMSDA